MFVEIKNFVFNIDEATHCVLTKEYFKIFSKHYKTNVRNNSIKIENCENLYDKICETFVKNGFVKIKERERVWLINKKLIHAFNTSGEFYYFSLEEELPLIIASNSDNELEVECIKNLCFEDRIVIE